MPIFGRSRTPREIVSHIGECLNVVSNANKSDRDRKKAQDELGKNLGNLKDLLTEKGASGSGGTSGGGGGSGLGGGGSSEERARISEILAEVSHEMFENGAAKLLLTHLDKVDFEGCKCVVDLFTSMLHRQAGHLYPTVQYLTVNNEILFILLKGYEKPSIATQYGAMLRETVKHERLCEIILFSEKFYEVFDHVHGTAFDTSSDAFNTLKDLLTRHKSLVSKYLDSNYDRFFSHYQTMIDSQNYVTRRQALKLLGELLLERFNFTVMTRYISDVENLKCSMNMLKNRQKQIAFEAFHCFKVFVANPNKPKSIHNILYQNQQRLVDFLTNFQTDRREDTQFNDEKEYLIKQIRELRPLVNANSSGNSSEGPAPSAPATSAST